MEKKFFKEWDGSGDISTAFTASIKNSTNNLSIFHGVASKAGAALKVLGASLANMAITYGISFLVNGLIEIVTTSDKVKQKASEVSSAFNSATSDIDGYKEKIQELHNVIDDSNSSFQEVTDARNKLYDIQKEMLDKYGSEVSAIDAITKAVNAQCKEVENDTKAWDELNKIQWQEAENDFNKSGFWQNISNKISGYSNNIERMKEEFGDYTSVFNLTEYAKRDSDEYKKLKKILEDNYGAVVTEYETGVSQVSIKGNADEVYNKLLDIQRLSDSLNFNDKFANSLTVAANSAKDTANQYKDFYNQYVLQEEVFNNNEHPEYTEYFEQITDAYDKYQDAISSNNEEDIEKAREKYAEIMSDAVSNVPDNVKYVFENLYPELQAEVSTWNFSVKFNADTDGMKGNIESSIKTLKGSGYSFEDVQNNLDDKNYLNIKDENIKSAFETLDQYTSDYNVTLSDLNNNLEETNRLESSNYKQAVEKFGKQNIDNLSDENKEVLYGIDEKTINDTINRVRQNAGTALSDTKDDVDILKTALNQLISEAKSGEDITPLSKSGMIDLINSMSDGFDVLDKIYADVFDGGSFDFTQLDTNKFKEAFSGLDNEYTAFIEKVSSSPNDISACQVAFDDLASAYINNSGVLDNVTEDTAQLTISMLENMGVANAAQLVNAALAENTTYLAAQKILAANASFDLANATAEEINALAADSNMADTTKQQIALLALQKQLCNEQIIKTDGDIANLQALAEQAGATQTAIAAIKLTNDKVSTAGSGRRYTNNPEDAKKLWDKTYNEVYGSISNNAKLKNPIGTTGTGTKTNTGASGYKPSYKGSTDTQKAQDKADKAAKSSEDTYDETIDFFEQRIKVLNQSLDILDKNLENVLGSKHKNQLLSAQSDVVSEEMKNYTDALAMYQKKADESLSKIDSSLRDKVVNGSVSLTEFIGKGNEDTVKAIQAYQNWEEKIGDCKEQLAALAKQLREIELSKFNNIVDEYTNKTDLFTKATDNISKQIDLFEQAGQIIGEGFYDAQKVNSQKQLNLLEEEKAKLVKQLNDSLSSGNMQKASDEWLEMVNTLSELDGNILDCKKSIEEMDDAILKLHTEQFERIQTAFSNIKTELEDLIDILDDSDVAITDGKWTDEGIAKLGLLAQQYETSRLQAQRYGEEIEQLNQDYLAGKYSATEYADKLADLKQSQYDSIKAYQDTEDAIIEVNKARVDIMVDGINEETEAYQKLIDSKKTALSAEKDLFEYRKQIADKNKSIINIENQLSALANDDSAYAKAQKAKLQEQLQEARDDLADYEYDHNIEKQQEALDKEQSDYEESQQQRIDSLNAYLENRNQVISDSFDVVKANTSTVANELTQIAQEHGVNISDTITSAWAQGSNAIASYGQMLSVQSSVFMGNLLNVQNGIYALSMEANNTANSLAYMFSTSADGLLSQLESSYNSVGNVKTASNALKDSLVNTLERGYNINSITNGLSSIKSSASEAASAVRDLNSALSGSGGSGGSSGSGSSVSSKNAITNADGDRDKQYSPNVKTEYYIQNSKTGRVVERGMTKQEAQRELERIEMVHGTGIYEVGHYRPTVTKYAKGGIVSKSKDSPLDAIAQSVGEDTMIAAKEGESVLTPNQTTAIQNLAEAVEKKDNGYSFIDDDGKEIHLEPVTKYDKVAEYLQKQFNELEAQGVNINKYMVQNLSDKTKFYHSWDAPQTIERTQVSQPVTIQMENMVNVEGNLDNVTLDQVKQVASKAINDFGRDINRQIKYGRR